jgi:hypothetical protein
MIPRSLHVNIGSNVHDIPDYLRNTYLKDPLILDPTFYNNPPTDSELIQMELLDLYISSIVESVNGAGVKK